MTKLLCSLVDLVGRLGVIRIDMLYRDGEVDKVLGKVAEQQTHEGLKGPTGERTRWFTNREWTKNRYTYLGSARSNCGDDTDSIQDELSASGKAKRK